MPRALQAGTGRAGRASLLPPAIPRWRCPCDSCLLLLWAKFSSSAVRILTLLRKAFTPIRA